MARSTQKRIIISVSVVIVLLLSVGGLIHIE
ncbi:MAG: hypothetical protein RJB39_123, partial [Candidatus Parcubacteria bacterium]